MATYPPPTENLAIFDDSVFQVNNTPLTPAEGDKRYLRFPNAQGTENMETTNVNGLLTMNAGGVVADTVLTFRDATDDTGNISGTSGSLVLTATTSVDLTAPQINLFSSTITEIQTPNLDVYSPNAFTTYLQLLPTYLAGFTDTATLYFGSTTQAANSYIGINSLTSMAMAISSTGSIVLNSAVDMVQLTTAPSGTVDAAIATVGYVNSATSDGFPSGFIGQSVRTGVNALPAGWVYCNGAQYPTTGIYANLYAVIGNSYGPAGFETFYVPSIAGQFLISSDNAGSGLLPISNISNENSQVGGANTLNSFQLPAHIHNINYVVNKSAGGGSYGQLVPNGQTSAGEYGYPTTSAGSSATFSPPYFATNFMIKL